jgi:hypothetical protein
MTSMAGGTRAEFVVDMEIPSSFWEDMIQSQFTLDVTNEQALADTEFDLDTLAGGTAPIDDALLTIAVTGSLTGLRLTDVATGGWISLTGALPSEIVINNAEFTVVDGSGDSVIVSVLRGGSNVLLPIVPMSSTAPPRLRVSCDSGTGSLSITVVARRRYVIA